MYHLRVESNRLSDGMTKGRLDSSNRCSVLTVTRRRPSVAGALRLWIVLIGLTTISLVTPALADVSFDDLLSSDNAAGVVRAYDGQTLEYKGDFQTGIDGPVGLAYLPDGDLAVAAWREDTIWRLDGITGEYKGTLATNIDNPRGLAVSDDGLLWASALSDNVVLVVDPATGQEVARLPADRPMHLAISDGSVYVTCQTDDAVQKYDVQTRSYVGPVATGLGTNPQGIRVAPDGKLILQTRDAPSQRRVLYRLDPTTGAILDSVFDYGGEGMAMGPDGLLYARGPGPDNNLCALDPITLDLHHVAIPDFPTTHGLTFVPVPEPTTMALFAVGGLALLPRKRRQPRQPCQ